MPQPRCIKCNIDFERYIPRCPACNDPIFIFPTEEPTTLIFPDVDTYKEEKEAAFVKELEQQDIEDKFGDGWSV